MRDFVKLKFIVLFVILCSNLFSHSVDLNLVYDSDKLKFINKGDLLLDKKKSVRDLDDLKVIIDKDVNILKKQLKYNGFFDADVTYDFNETKNKFNVTYHVIEKEKYTIKEVLFNYEDSKTVVTKEENRLFDIDYIAKLSDEYVSKKNDSGYPDAKLISSEVFINNAEKTVIVEFKILNGQSAVFGETKIVGTSKVEDEYILKRLLWKKGEQFNKKFLVDTEKKLLSTYLFKDVKITHSSIYNGKVDITVNVTEDKQKVFEILAKFATANNVNYRKAGVDKLRGIILRGSWTNQNVFGKGEILKLSAEGMVFYETKKIVRATNNDVSPDYEYKIEYTKDWNNEYKNKASLIYKHEWTTKYIKNGIQCLDEIFNSQHSKFNNIYSCCFEYYKLMEFLTQLEKKHFAYLTFAYKFDADFRDNFLDAKSGLRSINVISPELCVNQLKANILYLSTKNYILTQFENLFNVVFIPWFSVKTILIGKKINIPSDKILYSGGVNSIRGYYTNFAGPVDGDIPRGGRSVLEIGTEFRKRFSETWGGCIFFESARVSNNQLPIGGRFYSSYGFGVRYYSSIGPIRVDIASPTKRRKGVDSLLQVVVSLGQNF